MAHTKQVQSFGGDRHKHGYALHIHPNRLLYRLRRFEQVSGCSLASAESLAEVWLALRAAAAAPEVAHRPSAGLGCHDS